MLKSSELIQLAVKNFLAEEPSYIEDAKSKFLCNAIMWAEDYVSQNHNRVLAKSISKLIVAEVSNAQSTVEPSYNITTYNSFNNYTVLNLSREESNLFLRLVYADILTEYFESIGD